ncbi:site-specific tyrosine recombinase XerD [Paenibacillus antibioticophila]|uniref:Site-specific tyrosine recombinase XerD n=1 Tax=Paenibacillus antibioticophila TaxID=1274374 RepID=A0A920CGS5_9BACL|nr:tyrosine-type recombinase/integrase [Paenibacillus antibioticophila]GIO39626.1 site-specific tyrosine recombinase XerD [Paenibacillus antibioticophila]
MSTKRRQNTLTSIENPSAVKQQLSFDELLQSFILDCKAKNLSPLTIRFYQDSVRQMKEAFREQQVPLDMYTIAVRDIKNHFIAYLFDKGKSDNTVNGRIKAVKQFLRYLFEEGWLTRNISEELHVVKAEKLMLQTFTKEQVVSLLEQPDRKTFTGYRDFTMMTVLLETGMRISELCHLKTSDLFFREQEIRIARGKGGRARRVPFQQTCAKIIRRYLDIRGDLETDALFVNINNEPISTRALQDKMQTYGLAANITGVRVSPHTFRHTMAKFYILNGGDPFTLRRILGHATLDMVDYYVELFSSDIKQQHKKFSPVENMKRII